MQDPEAGAGGTKIGKRPPPQQQQPSPQQIQQMQQMQQQQQQPSPQQMQQQLSPQQMQQMQQHHQMQQQQPVQFSKKSTFGSVDTGSVTFKYTLLVILLFIILNSKIIWKQFARFPMMGQVEPSIIALFVNSLLAGVIFYVVCTFILK